MMKMSNRGMEQTNTTTETSEPGAPAIGMVRPREGRIVAGVAQGLANRLGLPVLLVRIVFGLLVFAGGLGLALYAAGWFLIRSEDEADTPAERLFSGASSGRSWIGIALVFLAALILLDNFTFLSGGVIWAVGLLIVGVLLYTGDLPRLVQTPADDKEGVQQMTTTTDTIATTETALPAAQTETPAGSGPVGGGTPPTPTPAPLPPPPVAPQPRETSYLGRITFGVMLISLGVLAILDNIEMLDIQADPRHYMALAVTVLGLGLIVGGFIGRARWLILVGVLAVPTLMFSPVFEYSWNPEEFDLRVTPDTFAELEDGYSLDVGNIMIDLTELPWDGQVVELDVSVDAGNIEVVLPADVGLVGRASLDVGQVTAPGQSSTGLGRPGLVFEEPGELGLLELYATANVGNIAITQD